MREIERTSGTETHTLESESPDETVELGRALGGELRPGDVLALIGPLGAGKTQFVRGLALGAGSMSRVTSPTFKLINEYVGRVRLYHIDAYRLDGPLDLVALGCDEFFDADDGAAVVEWADRVEAALPDERIEIKFDIIGPEARHLELIPRGERFRELAERIT